jgi:DNA-binding MarR family transcriptional regulator
VATARNSSSAPTSVQQAIKQARPFRNRRQEAVVAVMLTAESVRWPFLDLLGSRHELTLQQYNVLRILRGAGAAGLPTLEIGARMIERTPGITRLLDRLEAKGLVERERSAADRRQVLCRLAPAGDKLLARLDKPVDRLDDTTTAGLDAGHSEILEMTR